VAHFLPPPPNFPAQDWPAHGRSPLFDSPAARDARAHIRSPAMPQEADFALLKNPLHKPLNFPTLAALARRIHADRLGRGLECVQQAVGWRDGTRIVVAIYRQGVDGERQTLIGYAWLGGTEADRERLEAALAAQQPPRLDRAALAEEAA